MPKPTPFRTITGLALSFSILTATFIVYEPEAEARAARYRRVPNVSQCERYSWKPRAKPVPGGRAANARVPFMTNSIHKYLTRLHQRGCGLTVQSTFRDCVTNSNVGGAQKSRHLCGAGADTAGCSKATAAAACRQSGLTYIEEGAGRFAHCQIDNFCDRINRAKEDGPGSPPPPPPPEEEPEKPRPGNACYYAIFSCTRDQAGAEQERARIGADLKVIRTSDVKAFNPGWYCVVAGPGTAAAAKAAQQKYQGRSPAYVKKGDCQ